MCSIHQLSGLQVTGKSNTIPVYFMVVCGARCGIFRSKVWNKPKYETEIPVPLELPGPEDGIEIRDDKTPLAVTVKMAEMFVENKNVSNVR